MIFNLQTNFISAAVLLLIQYSNKNSRVYLPENKSFRELLMHLLILLVLDSTTLAVNARLFPGAHFLNSALNYIYYAEQAVVGYKWGMYSHSLTNMQLAQKRLWIYRIPVIAALLLLLTNPHTQSIFVISPDNTYARGWGFFGIIYAICVFFYLVEAMVLAVLQVTRTSLQGRSDGLNLLGSSALPVLGACLQMIFYGVSTIWSFGAIGLLNLYFNVQALHNAQAERELVDSRTSIMLSQIQPHFLYNALLGIKQLCDVEPQKASDALEHFSYYLRGNLDALTDIRLIPFKKELIHVKDYLYLEKMRFSKKLNIEWDIEYEDYFLPPLTLQPIVENAVRHGITKKKGGGTLSIKSERIEDAVVITITDNGIGFDKNEPKQDGRTHIGIENVKKRLSIQCGGSLLIESEKGVGTQVIMVLPHREEFDENYSSR